MYMYEYHVKEHDTEFGFQEILIKYDVWRIFEWIGIQEV